MILDFKRHEEILIPKLKYLKGYYLTDIIKDPISDPLSCVGTRFLFRKGDSCFYAYIAKYLPDPIAEGNKLIICFHNRDKNVEDKQICMHISDKLNIDEEGVFDQIFLQSLIMYTKTVDDRYLE